VPHIFQSVESPSLREYTEENILTAYTRPNAIVGDSVKQLEGHHIVTKTR
jgi:hypothetical protein